MDRRIHDLKTWPEFFIALVRGEKTSEIRLDDRGYAPGDVLRLREYDPVGHVYTGRETARRVSHVLVGTQFGLAEGYVAMSLQALAAAEAASDD